MRTSTLVGTALATASTAVIGSIASKRGVETWYPKLDKPGYVPPNGVFPVAWTTLYADIAVTSASAIDRMRDDGDGRSAPQLRRGAGRQPGAQCRLELVVLPAEQAWRPRAIAAAALAVSSADLARRTAQVNPGAGLALSAYPAWCSFAAVMSIDIWRRNR